MAEIDYYAALSELLGKGMISELYVSPVSRKGERSFLKIRASSGGAGKWWCEAVSSHHTLNGLAKDIYQDFMESIERIAKDCTR